MSDQTKLDGMETISMDGFFFAWDSNNDAPMTLNHTIIPGNEDPSPFIPIFQKEVQLIGFMSEIVKKKGVGICFMVHVITNCIEFFEDVFSNGCRLMVNPTFNEEGCLRWGEVTEHQVMSEPGSN